MKTTIKKMEKKFERIQSVMRWVNEESLRMAYEKQPDSDVKRKYGERMDVNIKDLLRRMRAFSYFPQSQDWPRMASMDGNSEKYVLRAFEDRMLLYLFGEILEAIFEPKIQRRMADLRKQEPTISSHRRIIIAMAVIEIDIVQFLRRVDRDYVVDFLRQSVADRNFVRYFDRFLQSGVKLLGKCKDLESESVVCFMSMLRCICVYYVLQLLGIMMGDDFSGAMWVVHDDKRVKFMFEKNMDCKKVYRQLCNEMRKIGLDPIEDKICCWKFTSQKKLLAPHCRHPIGVRYPNRKSICQKMRFNFKRRQ